MKKIEDTAEWVKRLDDLSHEELNSVFIKVFGMSLSDDQYRKESSEHGASLIVKGSAIGYPFPASESEQKERLLDSVAEALGCDGWTYDQSNDVVFEGPEDYSWCDFDPRNPFPK